MKMLAEPAGVLEMTRLCLRDQGPSASEHPTTREKSRTLLAPCSSIRICRREANGTGTLARPESEEEDLTHSCTYVHSRRPLTDCQTNVLPSSAEEGPSVSEVGGSSGW